MAVPGDKSKKHVRNAASVVPILPLSTSDKKWRKPSQAVNDIVETLPAPVAQPSEEVEAEREIKDLQEIAAQPSEITTTNAGSAHDVDEKQIPQSEGLTTDVTEDVAQSSTLIVDDQTTRSRSSTLIAYEVGEVAGSSVTQPDTFTSSQEKVEGASKDILPAESPQVPLTEEDTQGSEPDNASMLRSNTTGLTDYGSNAGESSLETVVLESERPIRSMTHRQSEAAPEPVVNGFAGKPSKNEKKRIKAAATFQPQRPRMSTIQDHLLYLVSSKQASDVAFQLNQPGVGFHSTVHPAHSAIIIRSPRIASLVPEYDQATATRIINLYPTRNIQPHAFDAALRFLYSDQTLTAETLVSPKILGDKQAKIGSLDYIMSYWLAGVELGIDAIKIRAYEYVQQIIGWDVAELFVKEIQGLRFAEESLTDAVDKNEVRGIADTLLSFVARLFVEGLNFQDFRIDTSAQVTAFPTRLSHLENRSTNPALSSMVFGSLPSQTMPAPTVESIASGILLNMEFNELQFIFKELVNWRGKPALTVMSHLIYLREERREKIIGNAAVPTSERLDNKTAWRPAGYKEFVKDDKLDRQYVGYLYSKTAS